MPNFTQSLKREFSHYGFEPVNLVTGSVAYEGVDFALRGIIPIQWKRVWYSDSSYCGLLGYGCHTLFDSHIQTFEKQNCVALLLEDGRVCGFDYLHEGEQHYNRSEKLTLRYLAEDKYEVYYHESRLTYTFVKAYRDTIFRLESIRDNYEHSIAVNFVRGNLVSIIDTVGRKIVFDCDDKKQITAAYLVVDKKEEVLVRYAYNEQGDMVGITDALDQTTHADDLQQVDNVSQRMSALLGDSWQDGIPSLKDKHAQMNTNFTH